MTHLVTLPDLGEEISEITISLWLRQSGEYIQKGEPICEIETDKAIMEFESPATGILKVIVSEGKTVKIGDTIAELSDQDSDNQVVSPLLNASPTLVYPSILASDFANLQREIEMLNQSQADWVHVDVMDGVFVPNISFGMPVCRAVHQLSKKPLDFHLMIVHPEKYIEAFKKCGAESITVHYEACDHLHRVIQQIRDVGCQVGVALNPHTPVAVLEDVLPYIDIVCVMSVNPGFGGQQFIHHTFGKLSKLKDLKIKTHSQAKIQIDGGVNLTNAEPLVQAGAEILVAGSSIFSSKNPKGTIAQLKSIS